MLQLDFLDKIIDAKSLKRHTVESDAVIVGSGAGGATAARILSSKGFRVCILEEGEFLTARNYGHLSPLEAVKLLYRNASMTFTLGNQSIIIPQGKCAGGTTVINSGTALRAEPDAISKWNDEYNLKELVSNLPRYYSFLETELGVKPVPSTTFSQNNAIFRRGTESLNFEGETLSRNEKECKGAGRCYLGCPNDAKQAMNVSFIPDAVRNGARLYVNCKADRIQVRAGVAEGVIANGGNITFKAHNIIVACGAVLTPTLLFSTPGIKGKGLGMNLKIHPASRVVGIMKEEVNGFKGVPQGYHVTQFLKDGISIEGIFLPPSLLGPSLPDIGEKLDSLMSKYTHFSMLGYRIIEDAQGRVAPKMFGLPKSWPMVFFSLTKSDIERLKKATAIACEILLAAGASSTLTPINKFSEINSKAQLEKLCQADLSADDIELSAYHAQGTCRMATTPENGVVDPNGEVFGVKNLFVADASILPSSPISNPQLTIMAFAMHVANKIAHSI